MSLDHGGFLRLANEDRVKLLEEFNSEYPEKLEFNVRGQIFVKEEEPPLEVGKFGVTLLPGKGNVDIHTILERSGRDNESVVNDIERIERFYDAVSFAALGRSVVVQPRLRSAEMSYRDPVGKKLLERASKVLDGLNALNVLDQEKSATVERGLSWYRDSFRAESAFNHYSMLWNALEVLVLKFDDSGAPGKDERLRASRSLIAEKGEALTFDDLDYLCNSILQQSIASRMKRGFSSIFAEKTSIPVAMCFERDPAETRLWRIRNDINHGNIVERNAVQQARVVAATSDLHTIVWNAISRALGLGLALSWA